MRRFWIHHVLPAAFCLRPAAGGGAGVRRRPGRTPAATTSPASQTSAIDWLILALGLSLFAAQTALAWRALRWRTPTSTSRPDRWLTHLSQAAEWFPLLGLIGTVAAILQTFSSITPGVDADAAGHHPKYAPAITATGSGLFMALVNILPTWIVAVGRDLIRRLAGAAPPPEPPRPGKVADGLLERGRGASRDHPAAPVRHPVLHPAHRRAHPPVLHLPADAVREQPPGPGGREGAAPEPPPAPPPADVQELQRQLAEARRRLDRPSGSGPAWPTA